MSFALENLFAALLMGSFDLCIRIPLQKSGKVFAIVKILPEGVYHYRFVVDGELRHAPDLPYIFDNKGKAMNVLDIQVIS